jgi:hypothetical protein
MFELQNGLILALYQRKDLAKDAKQPVWASSPSEFGMVGILLGKSKNKIAGHSQISGPQQSSFLDAYNGITSASRYKGVRKTNFRLSSFVFDACSAACYYVVIDFAEVTSIVHINY